MKSCRQKQQSNWHKLCLITIDYNLNSSQISHKQLVLVAAPIFIGAYFFSANRLTAINPVKLPSPSNKISAKSKDRPVVKYFCTSSIIIPYKITYNAILLNITGKLDGSAVNL